MAEALEISESETKLIINIQDWLVLGLTSVAII